MSRGFTRHTLTTSSPGAIDGRFDRKSRGCYGADSRFDYLREQAHGDQANLPATHHSAPARARVPEQDVVAGRPPGVEVTPQQGSQAPDGGVGARPVPARKLGRLRRGREFDGAYSEGTVTNGSLFVVRVRPNGLMSNRWGFAVGKRLLPRATERNHARRKMREAARTIAIPGGFDIIVTATSRSLAVPFVALREGLERDVQSGLKRAAK